MYSRHPDPRPCRGEVWAALADTTSAGSGGTAGKFPKAVFWWQFREFDTFLGKGHHIFNKINNKKKSTKYMLQKSRGVFFLNRPKRRRQLPPAAQCWGTPKPVTNDNYESETSTCFKNVDFSKSRVRNLEMCLGTVSACPTIQIWGQFKIHNIQLFFSGWGHAGIICSIGSQLAPLEQWAWACTLLPMQLSCKLPYRGMGLVPC